MISGSDEDITSLCAKITTALMTAHMTAKTKQGAGIERQWDYLRSRPLCGTTFKEGLSEKGIAM